MQTRTFPIYRMWRRDSAGGMSFHGLKEIPWELIEPHGERAQHNHGGQTLEELAHRGGLCACETLAVLGDRAWRAYPDHAVAEEELRQEVERWTNSHS